MLNGIVNFRSVVVDETESLPLVDSLTFTPDCVNDNLIVNMGMISKSQLYAVGSSAGNTMFEVTLNNDGAESVRIAFSGIISPFDTHLFATSCPSLGVLLREANGQILSPFQPREYRLVPGINTLRFSACLSVASPDVVPGEVVAMAEFVLSYR